MGNIGWIQLVIVVVVIIAPGFIVVAIANRYWPGALDDNNRRGFTRAITGLYILLYFVLPLFNLAQDEPPLDRPFIQMAAGLIVFYLSWRFGYIKTFLTINSGIFLFMIIAGTSYLFWQ